MADQAPALLVVEDEAMLLLDVEETLRDAGFEPVTASDSKTALVRIEAEGAHYAALITDIDLGPGHSGWHLARSARHLNPGLPVVYMSGASHNQWAAEGVPRSVMLSKPFAPAQLVTAVSTLITEAQMMSGALPEEG